MKQTSRDRLRFLAWPGYSVGVILVLFPLADALLSISPMQFGEAQWRFGAAGQMSRALMTPLLGLLIILGLGLLLNHKWVQRGLAVMAGAAAPTVLAIAVIFALDALQIRARIPPETKLGFDITTGIAFAKYLIGAAIALAISVVGFQAANVTSHGSPDPSVLIRSDPSHASRSSVAQ
jgi:hypothetical protein